MSSIDLTFESSGDCIIDPCGAYDEIVSLRERIAELEDKVIRAEDTLRSISLCYDMPKTILNNVNGYFAIGAQQAEGETE